MEPKQQKLEQNSKYFRNTLDIAICNYNHPVKFLYMTSQALPRGLCTVSRA